jgi:hypothetical protein
MDEGKVLIMNLSKGRIGEDTSQLLGSMMITQIQMAAMTRVNIPEADRKDFFLYVDEFQNFATESFAGILSEARKYHLNLVVAHQYIDQLSDEVKAAVFGNVGTMVVFRVGAADATVLAPDFMPRFTEEDLVNLTKWEIYLKLMINGVASEAFSANTLPPLFEPEAEGTAEKIIRISRERYSKNREEVEDKITRWSMGEAGEAAGLEDDEDERRAGREPELLEIEFKGKMVKAEVADRALPDRNIPWICDSCGKITHLSFVPKKPGVYCKNCLRDINAGKKQPPTLSNNTNNSSVAKEAAPKKEKDRDRRPGGGKPNRGDKSSVQLPEVAVEKSAKPSQNPQPKPQEDKPQDSGGQGGGGDSGTAISLDGIM